MREVKGADIEIGDTMLIGAVPLDRRRVLSHGQRERGYRVLSVEGPEPTRRSSQQFVRVLPEEMVLCDLTLGVTSRTTVFP